VFVVKISGPGVITARYDILKVQSLLIYSSGLGEVVGIRWEVLTNFWKNPTWQ